MQYPQPLWRNLDVHLAETSGIAARPIEAGDKTNFHRVSAEAEDDRDCRSRGFGRERRWRIARRDNDGHLAAD